MVAIVNETDGTGKAFYGSGGNGLAYEKLYEGNTEVENEGNLFVYHYDHLGSTKLVTDKDGSIVSKYNYGTYGELLTTEYGHVVEW